MYKNLENLSDQDLVKLALKSQDDFGYLITRYQAPLTRYVRRISNFSAEDVEDLLQEVFIKVYRNLNEFNQSLKFSSWIYRITHNEVISQFRKVKARPETYDSELNENILQKIKSELDVEKEIDQTLNKEIFQKLLKSIDIKYREILILRYFEDKDYTEISDILKKPKGTVATLLNRAKKKLLEQYEQSTK